MLVRPSSAYVLSQDNFLGFLSADYILICHFLGLLLGNSWPIEKVEDQLSQ